MTAVTVEMENVVVMAHGRAIVDNVTLKIHAGERIAIIGPNGAGKSTLIKLLSGMVQPRHGKVRVLDWNLFRPLRPRELRRLRAKVGQVFQGLHLVQRLTVLENVLLGSLARNRSWLTWLRLFSVSQMEQAESALQKMGLIGKADVRADRLSGGERQKTAIARMMMQQASLILADEPTAALDPVASADIAHILSSLSRKTQATLITVVHDPSLLPLLADRVIGLRHGHIVFDLPTEEVGDQALNGLYRETASTGWIARFNQTSEPKNLEANS
jgi:phosphonate transport system ATP-binding protein